MHACKEVLIEMRLCRYAELLKEIRLGNVKKVAFFDNDDIMEDRKEFQPVEGPCLVIFHDDRVAHSYVPRYDFRIPCGAAYSFIEPCLATLTSVKHWQCCACRNLCKPERIWVDLAWDISSMQVWKKT